MPSTIPYHPSLSLGSIVSSPILDNLKEISAAQQPAEAAQEKLNSLIALKRSLYMTTLEMINMEIDTSFLTQKVEEVKRSITDAAVAYAQARLECEAKTQELRSKAYGLTSDFESPLNYEKSKILAFEGGSNSLKLDSQYFSYATEEKESKTLGKIKDFLSSSLPSDQAGSAQAVNSSLEKINDHRMSHNVRGTLIITASCTHRNMGILAPLVMDPDKAVSTWNAVFPTDAINTEDRGSMVRDATRAHSENENSLSIVSGVVYGSSFVGMIHVAERSNSTQSLSESEISQIIQNIEKKLAVENASGGFADPELYSDLLTKSNLGFDSHITIVTTGVIPSIASNQMTSAGLKLAHPIENGDPGSDSQNFGGASMYSKSAAQQAQNRILKMNWAKVEPVLKVIDKSDKEQNNNLNMSTLIKAFDSYIATVLGKDPASKNAVSASGVPVHYLIKRITKYDVLRVWYAREKSLAAGVAQEEKDKDKKNDDDDDDNYGRNQGYRGSNY